MDDRRRRKVGNRHKETLRDAVRGERKEEGSPLYALSGLSVCRGPNKIERKRGCVCVFAMMFPCGIDCAESWPSLGSVLVTTVRVRVFLLTRTVLRLCLLDACLEGGGLVELRGGQAVALAGLVREAVRVAHAVCDAALVRGG